MLDIRMLPDEDVDAFYEQDESGIDLGYGYGFGWSIDQRAFGISRNLVPAGDLDVPVVRCSSYLRLEKPCNVSLRLLRRSSACSETAFRLSTCGAIRPQFVEQEQSGLSSIRACVRLYVPRPGASSERLDASGSSPPDTEPCVGRDRRFW